MKNSKLIAGILVVNIFLIAMLFFRMEQKKQQELDELVLGTETTPATVQTIERTQEAPAAEPEPVATKVERTEQAWEMVAPPPELDASDETVMEAVMSINPELAVWVADEERIRKLVLMVNSIANGQFPNKHLPVQYAGKPFAVEAAGQDAGENPLYIANTANYSRYEKLILAVTQMPVDQIADYYLRWSPLLEQAYAELGEGGSFHSQLLKAMDNIIQARVFEERALLKQPNVFYQFTDADKESANGIEKWLWRLGPENTRRLKNYLQALKQTQ